MEPTIVQPVCDQLGCPAFGVDELLIHGQDFRFCHHHAVEVAGVLIVPAVKLTSRSQPAASRPKLRRPSLVRR